MRQIFFTIALILCCIAANAQSPRLPKYTKGNNVIALHPGAVISNIVFPNGSNSNEYIISYRRIFAKANALKFGINARTSNADQIKNDTIIQKSSNNGYKIGLGYERYFALTKAWNFYIGADGQYAINESKTESPLNTNWQFQKNRENENNLLGTIGIMVNINSKIAVGLESGYKQIFSNRVNTINQKVNGVFKDVVTETKSATSNYVQPQLQLRMKF
jgi:hypothetical protein